MFDSTEKKIFLTFKGFSVYEEQQHKQHLWKTSSKHGEPDVSLVISFYIKMINELYELVTSSGLFRADFLCLNGSAAVDKVFFFSCTNL